MIIEWNQHMFSSDTASYPFHPRAAYRPAQQTLSSDPLNEYLQRMQREAIDRAVLVHPEPYGDDHRLLLDCLTCEPNRLRGSCLFYPNDTDAPEKLEQLVSAQPGVIATRFHAHRGKELYLKTFDDDGVRSLWGKAVDLGLIVELHIGPDYAEQVALVLRDLPETIALIDHFAEPHLGDAVEFAKVLELSEFPRVYMKLSGLNHFARDEPFYKSVQSFTRLVIDTFGPRRLVWGSGSPKIIDVHMAGYNESDRALVKGGNLAELIDFE